MTDRAHRRIAIIGAGPIGLEAALFARRHDYDVEIFERDEPGAHIERWSHVEFFSPWRLNCSPWGREALRDAGHSLPDEDAYPTGGEYLDDYLRPLAKLVEDEANLHTGCRVRQVSRRRMLKGEHIGSDRRTESPFLLDVERDGNRAFHETDVVLDTTGVYDTPNGLGPGGLRAIGEERCANVIDYGIPDVLGEDRSSFAGNRTLVIGAGHSAVTTLAALEKLHRNVPATDVHWLRMHESEAPYARIDDDPLPQRDRLARFGNRAARGDIDGIEPRVGHVVRLQKRDDGLHVSTALPNGDDEATLTVDRLVANVGYRPNTELFRELQVHQCYATEGPMRLAASLMGDDSEDCLDSSGGDAELLVNPEPNFFILGAKSYGRNSNFLLQVGFEQITQTFELLT